MKLLAPPKKTRAKHGRRASGKGPKRDPITGRLFGGNPGNKGGGRPLGPSMEFKEFLATEILGSEQLRKNLKDIVECDIAAAAGRDPVLAVRAAGLVIQVAQWAADRVEGKATQPLRFDPTETERVAALRQMTNAELIAALKTIDSAEVHG